MQKEDKVTKAFVQLIDEFFVYTNIYPFNDTISNTTNIANIANDQSDIDKELILFQNFLSLILFCIIISLSLLGLIKTIILLIDYIIFNISTYCHVLFSLCFSGCKINVCKSLNKNCIRTGSEIKKFFLFNFYSFENKLKGSVIIFLYLIFLFYNIAFTIMSFTQKEKKERSTKINILLISCYWVNVFFELYLPIFYYTRKKNKQLLFFSFFFILAVIGFICIGMIVYAEYTIGFGPVFYKIYICGYSCVLVLLNCLAIKKIYRYNPRKKAMKLYLSQPYKASNNDETIMISSYSKEELNIISQKFQLNNVYLTQGKGLYYHSKDKLYYRNTIFIMFIINALLKATNLIITVISPKEMPYIPSPEVPTNDTFSNSNESKELSLTIIIKKSFLVLDTALLFTLAWFTFIKIEIKRHTLY